MSIMPAGDGLTVTWYARRRYLAHCVACGRPIATNQRAAALSRSGFSHKFADTSECVLVARTEHLV
jgi:hypothetical protein